MSAEGRVSLPLKMHQGTHYQVFGDTTKPTIVLVHGVGLDHTMWQSQVRSLTSNYQVLTYDLTGHGLSQHATPATDLATLAQQLLQLMDHLQLPKVNLVGFSLGGLVAREGVARVSLPGGCAIGNRPVDLHLKGLEQLGAKIDVQNGYIEARAPKGLKGGHVVFPFISVGATENLMMAACLARGESVLSNVAKEPEVTDLGKCLIAMGAEINGLGTDTLTIQGNKSLHGATHNVIADRIETGTYAMAAAMTGGDVELVGPDIAHNEALIDVLRMAGIKVTETKKGFRVSLGRGRIKGVDVMTEPYPGFPTDLQAQMMAMMSVASGAAMITETIFENRFMHVPELSRMGANITVHGGSAMVRGQKSLTGAEVMATDLRASVSLVLAGLVADGETVVNRVYHLDRGYEKLEDKLSACGADIVRLKQ